MPATSMNDATSLSSTTVLVVSRIPIAWEKDETKKMGNVSSLDGIWLGLRRISGSIPAPNRDGCEL